MTRKYCYLPHLALTILVTALCWSRAFSQVGNFRGSIIYRFTSQTSDSMQRQIQLKYTFTDSTVTVAPLGGMQGFEIAMLFQNLTMYHSRRFGDSAMVIRHDSAATYLVDHAVDESDTINVLGRHCQKLKGKHSGSGQLVNFETRFDAYLSDLRFVCPPVFKSYDLVFNNSTGRIPLFLKKVESFAGPGSTNIHSISIEMEAIEITPD